MSVQFHIENQSDRRVVLYLNSITPRLVTEVHQALKAWIYQGANVSVTKYFAAGQSVARGARNTGDVLISRTGTLRRSVVASVESGMTPASPSPDTLVITAQWGAATPYARIQEKGGWAGRHVNISPSVTAGGSYIPPRPYLGTALNDQRPKLIAAIQGAVERALATS